MMVWQQWFPVLSCEFFFPVLYTHIWSNIFLSNHSITSKLIGYRYALPSLEGSPVAFGMSSEASIAEDEPRETIESPWAKKSLKASKGKGR
jgi:hypothetical protein